MSAYSITTRHKGKMAFEAEIGNHKVIMDTVAGGGGEDSGPPPKKLLLGTLATCTGMDVVSLLQKMRVAYSDFDIVTNADLTEEHPKVFSNIEIIYRIKVDKKDQEKVEKAVTLSQEKYCGISAMLRKNSPLNYHIEYL
ncbi:MAG: OsmC family protein [Lewinellaceae bacterium]|nr:OsmC family protein [Lewinellaceae bacterium]